MRAIYLGKDKPAAVAGLDHLVERGVDVVAVVAPDPEPGRDRSLAGAARDHGIPLRTDEDLYGILDGTPDAELSLEDVDLVLSFLFWKRIRAPLIELPNVGCLNFHPAPLPDYRGLGGYNVAILEELEEWGVSAHFVEETFDTGAIVEVRRFGIDSRAETAYSLEQTTQRHLLTLFRDVVDRALEQGRLEGTPQGPGRYIDRAEFERLRRIDPGDGPEEIERKIRAFWYPPHRGATIELAGETYTLVDDALLEEIAEKYRR